MTRIGDWYRHRSERERSILRAALLAALALLLLGSWVQTERSRERLAEELPRLRASIAALERDAEEVRRLRALPAAAAPAPAPLASLATNSGGVPGARIAVLDERRVRLESADVAFAALLEWLGNARATHGMRVETARIEALPVAGRVRAELVVSKP